MKNKSVLYKILTLFFAITMIFAFGQRIFAAPAKEAVTEESLIWINPEYEDYVTEDDVTEYVESVLNEESEANENGYSLHTAEPDAVTYTTSEQCAAALKEQMLQRMATCQFLYRCKKEDWNLSSFDNGIRTLAYMHEGAAPNEGDYLRWHVGYYQIKTSRTSSGGSPYYDVTVTITVKYWDTLEEEKQVADEINRLIAELGLNAKTEKGKIDEVYRYITSTVTYNHTAAAENASNGNSLYPHAWAAYGALIDKNCVCQGYANSMYRILNQVGVDTRIITGTGNNGAHAWNIVKIGDLYYNIDSTWDAGRVGYSNYLKNRTDFAGHVRNCSEDTVSFNKMYPIALKSWDGTSVDNEDSCYPCSVSNPSYTFTGIDGNAITTTAQDKPKIFVFGLTQNTVSATEYVPDSYCYNACKVLNGLEPVVKGKVDAYYIDVAQQSKEMAVKFKEYGGFDNIIFGTDSTSGAASANNFYVGAAGFRGTYKRPVTVLIDGNNKVRYSSKEAIDKDTLLAVIGEVSGQSIEAPTGLEATIDESGNVTVDFNPVAGADKYIILRQWENECAFSRVATVTTTHFEETLSDYNRHEYCYKVCAVIDGVEGTHSAKVGFYADDRLKIKYVLEGGNNDPSNPGHVAKDAPAFTLSNPIRDGYVFKGWYKDAQLTQTISVINPADYTENITVYAKWEPAVYSIEYELYGGTNNELNPDSYTILSDTIYLQHPAKPGYTSLGWYSDPAYNTMHNRIYNGSFGNVKLYVKWVPTEYDIAYELNGGTQNALNPDSYNVEMGTFNLEAPVREGFDFKGWYMDANYTTPRSKINPGIGAGKDCTNILLYARWEKIFKITGIQKTVNYTGNAITFPDLKVQYGDKILVAGTDYTAKYTNNKLGEAKLTLTGKGNYVFSLTENFTIIKADELLGDKNFNKYSITLSQGKFTYNGENQKPSVNIKTADKVYNSETDSEWVNKYFNISYSNDNAVSAGKYSVYVSPKNIENGYVKSYSKTYTIAPKKALDVKVYVVGGKAVQFNPSGTVLEDKNIVVMDGANRLICGKDYIVKYSSNKKCGPGKFTINFIGDYKGSKVAAGSDNTFTIVPRTVEDTEIQVVFPAKALKKGAYTAVKPQVTVDGYLLKAADYRLEYLNEYNEPANKNNVVFTGGKATVNVILKLKGNYSSEEIKRSYILCDSVAGCRDLSKAKLEVTKSFEYSGSPVSADELKDYVTVTLDGETVNPECYEIKLTNAVNKGKGKIAVIGIIEKGYAGFKEGNFTITGKSIITNY